MKNEAISKIEVLYLNALHSDREKLVGWSDFPNGIQEEEQVRKKICDKRWLRMSTPHADPKDLHSRVVFTFALQAPDEKENWGILLQPLRWCCVDYVIHLERDVREE